MSFLREEREGFLGVVLCSMRVRVNVREYLLFVELLFSDELSVWMT